jgi:pyruvate dehydrogenase E2 component (dihydrolipoamide acetyltransferase)
VIDFLMPSLGADMEAGTLVAWKRGPGDAVNRGDIIAEVETEKGLIEVEVFADGVIDAILVEPGTKVPVGTPLARIREAGGTPSPQPPAATAPEVTTEEPHAAMRRAIGAAMSRSKREIPHYYLAHTVDLGVATEWLAVYNAERTPDTRLVAGALFVKAVARALREVPELNARWTGENAPPVDEIHVGLAISLRGGGLVAPAIHHADRLTLPETMQAMSDLVARARTGTLRSSEMSDPTITVTSLGERGVDTVFPIVHPPQVAMVGIGTPAQRPWVSAGAVVARPVATCTLAADHRVTDGHRGARFLAAIDALLQTPEVLR